MSKPKQVQTAVGKIQLPILWSAVIAFVIMAGLGIYLLFSAPSQTNRSIAIADNGTPRLVIAPEERDLGTIDASQGMLTTIFSVQNEGDGDLVINEMETSCGCTSATLIINGKEGPRYGMRGHGTWPTGWSARLKPSESAQLRVIYDPNAHGFFEGPVERTVIIYSNDLAQPQKQIRFIGNQIGGQKK